MTDIAQTLEYVKQLHREHLDQLGRPYHTHLERVLAHVQRLFPDADEDVQHAALLHGSVEERKTTLQALRDAGYSPAIVRMVEWNTRPRGPDAPPYLDWIRHVADDAPVGAVMIKIADNEDNNDPRRIAQLPEERRDVSDVYAKARRILEAALHRRSRAAGSTAARTASDLIYQIR